MTNKKSKTKPQNSEILKFTATGIIANKRDAKELSENEISWFINEFLNGNITDYQMTALLMAIFLNGMSKKETAILTNTMLFSGKVLALRDSSVVDKHSTGGVGDKTSFIVAPLARACGVKVPMIAGRGLGHTGGTVDKIESLAGFNTGLSLEQFEENLYQHGIVLMGQTKEIAPADKRIYALRDVTSTVESIPLITASIMSKKLAEGARGFVFDIKVGEGAFMKDFKRARLLAKSLTETGARFNRDVLTTITDMNTPLGKMIGNSLEIIECIEILKGKGPKDLRDLSLHLAGGMVFVANKAKTLEEGIKKVTKALDSGEGLFWFKELLKLHGANPSIVDNYDQIPIAELKTPIPALTSGFIHKIAPVQLGQFLVELGGGRKRKEDNIDFSVGIVLEKQYGEKINKNETVAYIYHHESQKKLVEDFIKNESEKIFVIRKAAPAKRKLIAETSIKRSFKNVPKT